MSREQSDEDLATYHTFELASDLIDMCQGDESVNKEENEGEEAETPESEKPMISTHVDAIQCIQDLIQFTANSNSPGLLELLYIMKNCVESGMVSQRKKQVTARYVEEKLLII